MGAEGIYAIILFVLLGLYYYVIFYLHQGMNITKETTDWGIIYHYKNDCCGFALYAYNDDNNTMYLSNVKVEQSARGRGLGNKIIKFADKEAKKYNYAVICLKVLKSSWVHGWYTNHGYIDFHYDDKDADYVWMKHTL